MTLDLDGSNPYWPKDMASGGGGATTFGTSVNPEADTPDAPENNKVDIVAVTFTEDNPLNIQIAVKTYPTSAAGFFVDWGDGSAIQQVAAATDTGVERQTTYHFYPDDSDGTSYTLTVTSNDSMDADQRIITYTTGEPPRVDQEDFIKITQLIVDPNPANAGKIDIATAIRPYGDSFSPYSVDWGDGSAVEYVNANTYGTHVYANHADGDNYTISVTSPNGEDTDTVDLSFPPPVAGTVVDPDAGVADPANNSIEITDVTFGTQNYAYVAISVNYLVGQGMTVDWGDGTRPDTEAGPYAGASHNYGPKATAGASYTISVTSTDTLDTDTRVVTFSGEKFTAFGLPHINNPDVEDAPEGNFVQIASFEFGEYPGSVKMYVQRMPDSNAGWTVNWGEGETETMAAGVGFAEHRYATIKGQSYTVTVKSLDGLDTDTRILEYP
jgi:hypothetical protein